MILQHQQNLLIRPVQADDDDRIVRVQVQAIQILTQKDYNS